MRAVDIGGDYRATASGGSPMRASPPPGEAEGFSQGNRLRRFPLPLASEVVQRPDLALEPAGVDEAAGDETLHGVGPLLDPRVADQRA